jgi:hypothetical protein
MKRIILLLCTSLILLSCQRNQIDIPEITLVELNEHINFLASDSLKGRKPGTPEGRVAAEYIRDQFRRFGYELLGEKGLQYFEVITSIEPGERNAMVIGNFEGKLNQDFIPLNFSADGQLDANVVFCGYGFEIENDSMQWNDFQDIDVERQWALILRADPEPENESSPYLSYSEDLSKVLAAKDHGAAGVLLVSGTILDARDELTKLEPDQMGSNSGIPVFHISRTTADTILARSGTTIKEIEMLLNNERRPRSFDCQARLIATSEINDITVHTQNVVGFLQGNDPLLKNEVVVFGAHYDHLGMGGPNSSSRALGETGVHYGADDNASGVATVIEIAEKLASRKSDLKRSVMVMAFGAEEMGLLGSKYFTANPLVDLENIVAMVNVDMVGRLKETNELMVGGTGTSTESESLLTDLAGGHNLKLAMSPNGFGPSDHSAFYVEDIPVFFFSTGAHGDYHTPDDVPERINFEGLKRLDDFIFDLGFELVNRPAALVFQEAGPKQQTTARRRSGVRLGIMPSFTQTDNKGLGVDAVSPGGPADLGGILKGDLIVAIEGKPVSNIYEYMDRMSKLDFGQTISVDVIREGEKYVFLIQLENK